MAATTMEPVQASEQALDINEIITEIFSHLSELPDLYHCALVNKSWYNVAIPSLWRKSPSWDTLTKLESTGALSKYLPYVRRQDLTVSESDVISRLDEPTERHVCVSQRVVELRVDGALGAYPIPNLRYLLHPALRILVLSATCTDTHLGEMNLSSFYGMIQQYAPSLQALILGRMFQVSSHYSHDHLNFLKGMPQLQNLEVDRWVGLSAGTKLMAYLAVRQGFERLVIHGNDIEMTIDELLPLPGPIFCSLRCLKFSQRRHIGHICTLLWRMTALESLRIQCLDSVEVSEILSSCPNLIELECTVRSEYDHAQDPFTADKLALRTQKYPKLRSLKLFYDEHWYPPTGPEWNIDAEKLESLATALPNIEALHLPLAIKADDLFNPGVGRKLPRLYDCSFSFVYFARTSFITHKARKWTTIFPSLAHLSLGETDLFTSFATGQAERPEVVQHFCNTCPHLYHITYDSMDDIQRAALAGLVHVISKRDSWPRPSSVDELILQRTYDAALRSPAP